VIVVVCLLSATIPAFRASRISAAESLVQHAVAEDKPFKRGARMIDHFQECFRSLKVPVE
jgi:hypothetical protein